MKREALPPRVLAIDPTSRGFGFAVLEGPGHLVDWGVRELRRGNPAGRLDSLTDLLSLYRPEVLVIEDCRDRASRRGRRAREMLAWVRVVAAEKDLAVGEVTNSAVHEMFGNNGKPTKHNTARTVAEYFPALAPRLPPKRKPWMSETERMAIFDAIAFALTFYFTAEQSRARR